jgi:hypothetical protein
MLLPAPVPLNALLDDNHELDPAAAACADVYAADVILGVDVVSQKQFIVFGRKTLRRLVRGGAGRGAKVLLIAVDEETEELPKLLTLVMATKGRHDYEEPSYRRLLAAEMAFLQKPFTSDALARKVREVLDG